MKSTESNSKILQTYQIWFVLVLTSLFLFVMVLSAKPQGFGKFEENFFQRNLLIENFNRLRIKLGDRVFNHVLIAKDGWMEFTANRNLDDYQNVIHFSSARLEGVAATIESCHQYAREHNMKFLIVVTPNKASIYPDKLPEQIRPLSDRSRLDQLNDYLRKHNIPEVLDLRPALREAREEKAVYYRLGTHWNPYGAYVAYETIIKFLSQDYPGLVPYSSKFLRFRNIPPDDLADLGDKRIAELIQANYLMIEPTLFPTRDLGEFFYEVNFPIPRELASYHKISWIPDSDLPSLLMYHDSFGDASLNKFLALNFSKVYYIHRNSARRFLNREIIEQFSPDIVIFQVVERNLNGLESQLRGCVEK